ncbi:MAG: M23 family metallopeptidase [Chitinophagales bacterium]
MKKEKYFYNIESLKFEKIEISWKSQLFRIIGFLSVAIFFALIIVVIAFQYFDSPKEKQLKRDLSQMKLKFEQINKELDFHAEVITSLQDRDENIYRTIFEADPIPNSVREAGFGGSDRFKHLETLTNSELIKETAERIETIGRELYIQSKSYDEIIDLAQNKEEMFASIPAIQPVSNRELRRLASGFGMRVHPIYKTRKMHTGIDFSATTGTPIYSTGKGRVVMTKRLKKGYGNYVVIDHGFNYKTLYAHMNDIKVREGQYVNRGDVIGTVGDTGTSTAPHLHYEVWKNGKKINPINFFYNDLSAEEFDKVLEIASRHNQSFD